MNTRPIPGFPRYVARDDGHIVSIATGQAMRGSASGGGYLKVFIGSRTDGSRTRQRVHRLVALAWLGPCPEGQEVRHLNDIRTDNRPSNLAYGTHSENTKDAYRNGRLKSGAEHKDSVIDADRVALILAGARSGLPYTQIASALRISDQTVRRVASLRHWSAGGDAACFMVGSNAAELLQEVAA